MSNQSNTWQIATLIKTEMISIDVKSLTFKLENPMPHLAGQHFSVKLTAEDGYIAERDYSLANPPEQKDQIEFGIQLLRSGEVSPYLFDLKPSEQIEVKGPIGHHFVWEANADNNPLLLIAGGSGMVPLRSMVLHHINNYKPRDVVFLTSCRTIEHVLYQFELEKLAEKYSDLKLIYTLTDKAPPNYKGYTRRVDDKMIEEVFAKFKDKNPKIFVCGPTPFVETVTKSLVTVGFNPEVIKTERFGGDNLNLGH
jgi:NAD(P)H-flavin reductase